MSFYRPHNRVTAPESGELVTKQSFKEECDINNILRTYKRTGIIEHIARATARFEDLPDSCDYQQSLNTLIEAENAFGQLPSKLRDRYDNDPAKFLAALGEEKNREEFERFGILKPRPTAPEHGGKTPSTSNAT